MSKDVESGSDVANPVIPPVQWAEDKANYLSFRAVDPVNVLVKDLNVTIDVSPGGLSTFATAFNRKTTHPEREIKSILKDVDAYMPSGSLTAIIGSSGSGKTFSAEQLVTPYCWRKTGDYWEHHIQWQPQAGEHQECLCHAARCLAAYLDSAGDFDVRCGIEATSSHNERGEKESSERSRTRAWTEELRQYWDRQQFP